MKAKGRPVLGAIAGFFALLFLAIDLILFGVIPLNSPLFTSLPILGLILGIALGVWAPFGAGKASSPQPARADESVILANHLR